MLDRVARSPAGFSATVIEVASKSPKLVAPGMKSIRNRFAAASIAAWMSLANGSFCLAMEPPQLPWDGVLTVRATATNNGPRIAEEVVQLYVHDVAASVTRPVRHLKGFAKLRLAPGETKPVAFTIRRADLLFPEVDLKPTVEPGTFRIWIAPSAQAAGVDAIFSLLVP